MAASASESQAQQSTTTTSVQGGAGQGSATITGGGNVTVTNSDADVSEAAITAAAQEVLAAIQGAGTVTNNSVNSLNQTTAATLSGTQEQEQTESELLDQVLQSNSALASYQGTGGGINAPQSTTTNYLIIGALALFALIFVGGRKSN